MKRISFLLIGVLIGLMLLNGCASIKSIPAPRAGLVLLVNKNEGAFAYCRLFQGHLSQDDIVIANQDTGGPEWGERSVAQFKVDSAYARDFWTTKSLILSPHWDYTLFIVWTRFTGQVLDIDTIHFNTSGNPFRSHHVDGLGRKTYADSIVYLPHIETSTVYRIRIHKTIYLGEWIKALIGLP